MLKNCRKSIRNLQSLGRFQGEITKNALKGLETCGTHQKWLELTILMVSKCAKSTLRPGLSLISRMFALTMASIDYTFNDYITKYIDTQKKATDNNGNAEEKLTTARVYYVILRVLNKLTSIEVLIVQPEFVKNSITRYFV